MTDDEEVFTDVSTAEGEYADDKLQEKREPRLTEMGLEYQKSLKLKERNYAVRILDKRKDSLKSLIEKDFDIDSVRMAYSTCLTMYEDCLDQCVSYQKLLNSSELTDDNAVFDVKNNYYKQIKDSCEKWILTHDRPPSVKLDNRSTISRRSSRSGSSSQSISSQISIAKLKGSQRKAELLAKAEALKRKRKLSRKKCL